jgi:hypothetical protein
MTGSTQTRLSRSLGLTQERASDLRRWNSCTVGGIGCSCSVGACIYYLALSYVLSPWDFRRIRYPRSTCCGAPSAQTINSVRKIASRGSWLAFSFLSPRSNFVLVSSFSLIFPFLISPRPDVDTHRTHLSTTVSQSTLVDNDIQSLPSWPAPSKLPECLPEVSIVVSRNLHFLIVPSGRPPRKQLAAKSSAARKTAVLSPLRRSLRIQLVAKSSAARKTLACPLVVPQSSAADWDSTLTRTRPQQVVWQSHRFHPGTVTLREIRRYQKSTDLLTPPTARS